MSGKYELNNVRLRCPVCGQEHFDYSHSLAELTGLPIRKQEKPGERHVFLCQSCKCGLWLPGEIEPEEILECFECGSEIDKTDERCKNCGWSYMSEETPS